jgi:hypothetical protein
MASCAKLRSHFWKKCLLTEILPQQVFGFFNTISYCKLPGRADSLFPGFCPGTATFSTSRRLEAVSCAFVQGRIRGFAPRVILTPLKNQYSVVFFCACLQDGTGNGMFLPVV